MWRRMGVPTLRFRPVHLLWLNVHNWLLIGHLDKGRHLDLYDIVFVVALVSHRRLVICAAPLPIHNEFVLMGARNQLVGTLQQKLEFVWRHLLHGNLLPVCERASYTNCVSAAGPLE